MAFSVVRAMTRDEELEPKLIIIKRCKMEDRDQGISEEEINQLMKDMEETPDDELEYLGDEDLDDEDVDEVSEEDMTDDDDDVDDDEPGSDDDKDEEEDENKSLKKLSF